MRKIGVFDSGIGGQSVANSLRRNFPEIEIIFLDDHNNLPYGSKSPELLKKLVRPKIQELVDDKCDLIVIACNTVTTTLLDWLKNIFDLPIIGVEPMIQEAADITKSNLITVCATPTTLSSPRYRELKQIYGHDLTINEPDCSNWTKMIESNDIDREAIKKIVDDACKGGSDVIVLGCTHYHWIEGLIKHFANNRAQVIQPEAKVVDTVKSML